MIKVKIVEGKAVETEMLDNRTKFSKIWNSIFAERFEVIPDEEFNVPAIEGNVYLAWSVGSGKVVLLKDITPG